jgi:hypothetical protein
LHHYHLQWLSHHLLFGIKNYILDMVFLREDHHPMKYLILVHMFQIPTIIIIDYLYKNQLEAYLQKDLLNLHKYKVHKLILPELPFLHPILWRYYPNPLILLDLDHPKQIWHKKLYWNDLAHQILLLLMPQLILLSIRHKLLQSYRNLQLQIMFHHNYNQLKAANWVHQI